MYCTISMVLTGRGVYTNPAAGTSEYGLTLQTEIHNASHTPTPLQQSASKYILVWTSEKGDPGADWTVTMIWNCVAGSWPPMAGRYNTENHPA